jgi:hypothetical protein
MGLREVSPALDQEVMIDDITLAATASFEDNANKLVYVCFYCYDNRLLMPSSIDSELLAT